MEDGIEITRSGPVKNANNAVHFAIRWRWWWRRRRSAVGTLRGLTANLMIEMDFRRAGKTALPDAEIIIVWIVTKLVNFMRSRRRIRTIRTFPVERWEIKRKIEIGRLERFVFFD